MTSMTLEISETRTITATGRLVAGETAQVTISGATPTALYLVAPDQTVVAACEAFTPTGQGTGGGVGFLQLATEQVAALFANTPAGRMIAVWALVNDADGVAGAGWVPVVSAPMPDALIDLDIDFYLRASQVGAGLAIVDGKLVCNVNPDNYLTKTEAAATYATKTALAGKQDTITDLAAIRSGAAAGATAYQKPATGIPATDLAAAVQTSLGKADTALPATDGTAHNSVTIDGGDGAPRVAWDIGEEEPALEIFPDRINYRDSSTVFQIFFPTDNGTLALRENLGYNLGTAITESDQLADRTVNRVAPLASNTSPIALTFPASQTGARDLLVLVTNTAGNTGSITFTPPTGATVYGDGFTNSPASGETWLYSVTEVANNVFWVKSVKMEVAQ